MRQSSEFPPPDEPGGEPGRETGRETAPGLIWAYAGDAAGVVRVAAQDLAAARAERGWVWIHVDLLDQRVHDWIHSLCDLPPGAVSLLAGREAGIATEPSPGEMHGVAADFLVDVERTATSVGRYVFSVSEGLLVTGRRHAVLGLEAARGALDEGARPASAFGVLGIAVIGFSRIAATRIEAAHRQLDAVEDHLLASGPSGDSAELKAVRRLALALHRPVSGMLDLFREAEDDDAELPAAGQAAVGGMAARLATLDQSVLQLSDRARLLQDEIMAEHANETNRSLRTLTVLSTLLLPGTLIAGIFGMNTDGLPFTTSDWGFWGAIAVCALATLIFQRVIARLGAAPRD